jgi:hypothetical protein
MNYYEGKTETGYEEYRTEHNIDAG